MKNTLRNFLFAVVALGLVATLVFFYSKTEAIDLSKRNEIVAMLRDLQSIDNRWDNDILRSRMELDDNPLGAPDRAAAARRTLKALSQALPSANSPALNVSFDEISRTITEKASLVRQYEDANARSKGALRMVLAAAGAKLEKTGLRPSARLKEFNQVLDRLASMALKYYWFGQDAQRNILEAETAHMAALASALRGAGASDLSVKMDGAIRTLLEAKPVEQDLYDKVSRVTSGPRLEGVTLSYNHELEIKLQDKERYRVYMIAYAAALLIGIAYLGIRLEAAKEGLERRVAERTRELSEALQHLKESEAQLIQSEKMSSLGQMVAGVAHEINTPLAYVSNSINSVSSRLPQIGGIIDNSEKLLQLLQDQNVNPDELNQQYALLAGEIGQLRRHSVLQELSGLVKDGIYGADQVKEIVGNLKDFSRLDRSKVASFNLNDGLESTLGLARHLIKSIRINKHYGEIPAITCSPSQINQVFLNLITNAVQALPEDDGEITLTTRTDGEGIAVDVADNGSGIAPEVLPKIFDPFFTTKEIGKGTGLGLSISYKIVRDHGGHIDVESEAGKGTRVSVWLPLQAQPETIAAS